MKLRLVGGPVAAGTKCECEVDGSWAFGDLMFAFAEAAGGALDGFNLHQTEIDGKKVKAGAVIDVTSTPNQLKLKNNSIIMIKKAGGSNPATPRDAKPDASPKPAAKAASPKATKAAAPSDKSYKERVIAIYQKYEPSKLGNVDKTMEKFKGQEEDVIKTLVKKYGPEPTDNEGAGAAASPGGATPKTPRAASAAPSDKSYKERVIAIYQKYEPSKLGNVDKTMEKFKGQEEDVIKTLVKKYGPEPTDDAPPATPRTPHASASQSATPAETPRDATPAASNNASPRDGAMSYRDRVVAIYQKYDPGKVGQTDALLKKHEGKEKNVIASLVKKYGPEPDPVPATPRSETTEPATGTPTAAVPPLNIAAPKSYRDRLIALYEKYDPSKVGQVDKLLKKYEGKEDQIIAQLVKKLGPEPGTEEGGAASSRAVSGGATPSTATGDGSVSSRGTYRDRVVAMYQKYDPAKVGQVDALLKKHEGKEKNVLASLVKKYGPEPDPAPVAAAAPPPAAATPKKAPTPPAVATPPASSTPRTPQEQRHVSIKEDPTPSSPPPASPTGDKEDDFDMTVAESEAGAAEVVMTPIATPRDEQPTPVQPVATPAEEKVGAVPMGALKQPVGRGKDRSNLMSLAMAHMARTQFDLPLLKKYFAYWVKESQRRCIDAKMKASVKAGEWEECKGEWEEGSGKFRPVGSDSSVEGVSLTEEFTRRQQLAPLEPSLDQKTRTLRQCLSSVNPDKFKVFPIGAYLQNSEVVQVLEESQAAVVTLSGQVKEAESAVEQHKAEAKEMHETRAKEVEELAVERKEMATVQATYNTLQTKVDGLEYETTEAKAQQQLAEQRHLKTKEKVNNLKEELRCERAGVPTNLEAELAAKDETIAKLHQQMAKMRTDMRTIGKQREQEREEHQKEIRKYQSKVRVSTQSAARQNYSASQPRFDAPTYSSKQKNYSQPLFGQGSESPDRYRNINSEFVPDPLDDTLEEDRRMIEGNEGENKKTTEEDEFNDDEVNLEPLTDRGQCPNCSTGLTAFNNEELDQMLETEKAAFCFSCRQSFTAKDLRIRDRRNAKRDQILAKHAQQY